MGGVLAWLGVFIGCFERKVVSILLGDNRKDGMFLNFTNKLIYLYS